MLTTYLKHQITLAVVPLNQTGGLSRHQIKADCIIACGLNMLSKKAENPIFFGLFARYSAYS